VYPDDRVIGIVTADFIPVRIHVRDQKEDFKKLGDRYGAHWTPTILLLDTDGEERHRIEGFLPADDFAAQLLLGLGRAGFSRGAFDEAERRFNDVVKSYPTTDAAAEALYWAGVSQYKLTGDASALAETARQFTTRYADTTWAKKASVWNR
jgi:hypothetical protein